MKKISKRKILLLSGDIGLVALSVAIAFFIVLGQWAGPSNLKARFLPAVFLVFIFLVSFYIFDLYNIRIKFSSARSLIHFASALLFAVFGSTVYFYIASISMSGAELSFCLALTGLLLFLWRIFFSLFFSLAGRPKNILIIGTGRQADRVASAVRANPEFRLVGFISGRPAKDEFSGKEILGDYSSLKLLAAQHKVQEIVVTGNAEDDKELIRSLVNCKMQGIVISDFPTFYEQSFQKLPVNDLSERWLLKSEGFGRLGNGIYGRIKRLTDLLLSFLILLPGLPAGVLIALATKITSRGPVFFKQERVGINFRPFSLIKFRTMFSTTADSEPKWTRENDPRVTPLGRFLRMTRLDELPQLINIIKGDMSLIGPRPERPYFVSQLIEKIPYYSLRFTTKPGLTGWAQVKFRYGSSEEDAIEKLRYDLYYIKNMSLFLDLRIILKTIRTILFVMGR